MTDKMRNILLFRANAARAGAVTGCALPMKDALGKQANQENFRKLLIAASGAFKANMHLGVAILFLASCSTPTLVEVARRGRVAQSGRDVKDDVTVPYHITDRDVLNFTDEVKRKLANRSNFHMGVRYGSATTQATLGALAGAAETAGWAASVASGFGMGATYVFGLGQIFDSKAHAQAYEQAFTGIQSAESKYYFYQVGMKFKESPPNSGKYVVDYSNVAEATANASNIPRSDLLTPDGQTLYYRVIKILKVLEDVLANKIPDLQDLKDAKGDTSQTTTATSPTKQ